MTGIKRAVLVVRRAEEAQPDVRLGGKPLHHGLGDARLADTGFARDQHDATVARFRLLPAPQQQLNLLVAADQRRRRGAQRLEAALDRACPQRRPGRTGSAMPLRSLAPRSCKLEEIAEKSSCALGDDDRVRLGDPLQARRKVRCLADDAALLRLPGSDQVADHDQPSRNADAGLKRTGCLQCTRPPRSTPSPARTARSASSSCACG